MPFCFLTQNVAEIGQSVDELWPKSDFQDGGRLQNGGRPPSWIFYAVFVM